MNEGSLIVYFIVDLGFQKSFFNWYFYLQFMLMCNSGKYFQGYIEFFFFFK